MLENEGYANPLDIQGFFETRRFRKVATDRSIAAHINLILTTAYSEYAFDPDFGCELWEHDFESQWVSKVWTDRMAASIRSILERYETRLTDLDIAAELAEAEFAIKEGEVVNRRLKMKLTVRLTGRLVHTNEPFRFATSVLLSPFSLD